MNRRQLRDYTFKMVFHVNYYTGEELLEQLDLYLEECEELTEEEQQELKARVLDFIEKQPEIDSRITAVSEGWKLSRMNKVDLSIIRLACYEMAYDEQVPQKVAINEAVELAKQYGGNESPQFVNGILAKLVIG